jgi:hypothetical protein
MGRFVRSTLVAVCLLFFSPCLPADGTHTERASSFSDHFIDFTHTDRASLGGDSASALDSNDDHWKGLDDSEDHPGKAWGWYKKDHHHHHDGDGAWNFADQDNEDTDGDSISGRDPSTSGVPEPSTLVLLSTALAAFLLKSNRRATV